jgi:GTP cyclohydrolase II
MSGLEIENRVCARIPTQDGEYQLCLYTTNQDDKEHLALIMGDVRDRPAILVRVHSECFTGDVLGSRRCDCGEQLHHSIQVIAEAGSGILIYLRQEGRGIGLLDKLRSYNLQDLGYDTVEANLVLGHQADERDYTIAAAILRDLQVESVCLLTNNPAKIEHLRRLGISVVKRIPLEPTITDENAGYLLTKVERMNHLLHLDPLPVASLKERNGSGNGSH